MNDINQDPATDQDPEAHAQGSPEPKAQAPNCETCPFRLKAMSDAENSKTPKGHRRLIDEIKDLEIPARAKAELAMLCVHGRELVRRVLRFIRRHRHIAESILLGTVIGYLLCFVPRIGGFLSLVALATSVAAGMVKELREQLAALFAADIPAYA